MTSHARRLRGSDSWHFDVLLLALALALLGMVAWRAALLGWDRDFAFAIPLGVAAIAVISRFPMTLNQANGWGVQVSFESSVLIFMLCTLGSVRAVLIWAIGVVVSEVVSGRRVTAMSANVGIRVLAGCAAGAVLEVVRGPLVATPREVLAVVVAVAAFFAVDYLLTAMSLSLETHIALRTNLSLGVSVLAVASFTCLNLLGYLGAVVLRYAPHWEASALLGIPLATVIGAARAVNGGAENQRRLTTLLGAAVRAQSLSQVEEVFEAITSDARQLLRPSEVTVRSTPPAKGEIGSQVTRGRDPHWVVAPKRAQVNQTAADQQALDALAAIAAHALARLQLTGEMVHFARHDPLTDLPNRGILQDRTTHALLLAKRRDTSLALLMLDLDGFKPVNDRFGHAAGDRVLIEVAGRLRACVRESDTVARLGGDEFAVLLQDIDREEALALGQRMLEAVSEGVTVSGALMPLGVSVGLAYSAADSTTEGILRQADQAMYEAKARGKGRLVEYDAAMGRSRLARLELIEALREAVIERRIGVHYQPVVEATTGRIAGVEALARWRLGTADIPPEEFIAVAEQVGLIAALGDVVLEKAARDASVMCEVAGRPIWISVNVSVQQLRDDRFIDVVRTAVDAMDGIQLILEVTERESIGADSLVHTAMHQIHELGVLVAIDDFGVGFSSFGYLQDVPAQIIKADRALSRNIDRDERACVLLRSVATLGRELGMEVVVEGIERESQLAVVRDAVHAKFAQGFLMHRPMPLSELVEVISADGPARSRPASRSSLVVVGPDDDQTLTLASSN